MPIQIMSVYGKHSLGYIFTNLRDLRLKLRYREHGVPHRRYIAQKWGSAEASKAIACKNAAYELFCSHWKLSPFHLQNRHSISTVLNLFQMADSPIEVLMRAVTPVSNGYSRSVFGGRHANQTSSKRRLLP